MDRGTAVEVFGGRVKLNLHVRGAVALKDLLKTFCPCPVLVVKAYEAHAYCIWFAAVCH